jgi:tellurite resistance protein
MVDDKQKRAFIALACKVAWADGVIADSERAQVTALLQRLGGEPVSSAELDEWLSTGAPPAELKDLSPAVGEMFIYEAWKLVQADGDIDDSEVKFIESLMTRVSKLHEGTPVAKVALVKKPAR